MKLSEFKRLLAEHPGTNIHFVLPTGTKIPLHAHVTDVARKDPPGNKAYGLPGARPMPPVIYEKEFHLIQIATEPETSQMLLREHSNGNTHTRSADFMYRQFMPQSSSRRNSPIGHWEPIERAERGL